MSSLESLLEALILSNQGPIFMALFNHNYFLRGPVSKYIWGLRLHHNVFGEVEAQFGPQPCEAGYPRSARGKVLTGKG